LRIGKVIGNVVPVGDDPRGVARLLRRGRCAEETIFCCELLDKSEIVRQNPLNVVLVDQRCHEATVADIVPRQRHDNCLVQKLQTLLGPPVDVRHIVRVKLAEDHFDQHHRQPLSTQLEQPGHFIPPKPQRGLVVFDHLFVGQHRVRQRVVLVIKPPTVARGASWEFEPDRPSEFVLSNRTLDPHVESLLGESHEVVLVSLVR
jgi:hypothetical protein